MDREIENFKELCIKERAKAIANEKARLEKERTLALGAFILNFANGCILKAREGKSEYECLKDKEMTTVFDDAELRGLAKDALSSAPYFFDVEFKEAAVGTYYGHNKYDRCVAKW